MLLTLTSWRIAAVQKEGPAAYLRTSLSTMSVRARVFPHLLCRSSAAASGDPSCSRSICSFVELVSQLAAAPVHAHQSAGCTHGIFALSHVSIAVLLSPFSLN